ncbi:MAG: D-alanyl-D-alanine carboxypeptidase/D-alanyl-D-alanine-endopeptidase [Thermoleophilia bacterium]|nr:D-alanyl-D-alanine carboxypeptidase/D-alanyl-D-alanine-endopeptidase [Thermoleophilia bacterium]
MLMLMLTLALVPATAQASSLVQRVSAAVAQSDVGASTSVIIYSVDQQSVLYRRAAGKPVSPASNMKVPTAIAALKVLGPERRFATSIFTRGDIVDGVLNGNVYLVGGGDPTLSTSQFARRHYDVPTATVEKLVRLLTTAGITHVTGKLVVDETWFDTQRFVSTWRKGFRYDEATALGALTVNQSYYGRRMSGRASRQPALQSGSQFRAALTRADITIDGPTVRNRKPDAAVKLGEVQSMPLSDIVRFMLTTSDNFTAEIVLKDIGRVGANSGSTSGGLAAERSALTQLGADNRALRAHDGSGLSYTNRMTTRYVSNLFNIADRDTTIGPAFRAALAIGGESGTLKHRFTKHPYRSHVIGKTGTLTVSSALSGWSTRADGTRYGFSIISYSSRGVNISQAKRLQNLVGQILVK